jgi:hypothetical protein
MSFLDLHQQDCMLMTQNYIEKSQLHRIVHSYKKLCRVRMFGVRITTWTLIPQNVKYWHSPAVKHLLFFNIIWVHPNWSVWMMKLIWGITVSSKFSWTTHINKIKVNANRLLGLLRRTCPLLTDRSIRRTLYLSLVKSQFKTIKQTNNNVVSNILMRMAFFQSGIAMNRNA